MKNIKNITIIGLGLIGGSLALSLKKVNDNFIITGYDNIPETMDIAIYRKLIDRPAVDYADSVKDADLVIIATPVRLIVEIANKIKDFLKSGTIVTDVGSAKENIVENMVQILPKDVVFIGGHPMTGSENDGVLSARNDLFVNAFYVLTPTDNTRTEALVALHTLFTKTGAKVITISPAEHDKIVSLISHLPHILSTNLVVLVDNQQKQLNNLFKLCAGGFRDMTRIAASNPKMWLDISIENKKEIINALNNYISHLNKFMKNLEAGNEEYIKNHYIQAKEARLNLPKFIDKDISKLYELRIGIPDKQGVLSEITLAISSAGINIEDISIFHSTEVIGGGILKILVHGENAGTLSRGAIEKLGYEVSVKKVTGEEN
ncbi:MAG: prephenate dehydrogenase [Actinobacteria bacterium]|nr:prephenate dehydrogenase [Cyanobacteriota bacterium]MCL6086896.1 prephenate dehydrogenase [Actinomycetota bacterium]